MPTLFPTSSDLDAGKYYDWKDVSNNVLWSGEATPTACKAPCDEQAECTAWETCNYGKVGSGCSGCYLFNKKDIVDPLVGSDMSWSAGLFVMGPDQGKSFDWKSISENILWSGELAPAGCKTSCESNEECTAWETCNFGKTSTDCSGCYLINKDDVDFPLENGDKSWQAAKIEESRNEEDVVKEAPTMPGSVPGNANETIPAPSTNTTTSDPVTNTTTPVQLANTTEPNPGANSTEPVPVANTTEPSPVANATSPDPALNATTPVPVVNTTAPAPVEAPTSEPDTNTTPPQQPQ